MSMGAAYSMGFSPLTSLSANDMIYFKPPEGAGNKVHMEGFGKTFIKEQIKGNVNPLPQQTVSPNSITGYRIQDGKAVRANMKDMIPSGAPGVAMSLIGPAVSAYYLVGGYQDNGIIGLTDAYFLDIAASSAAVSANYSRGVGPTDKMVTQNPVLKGTVGVSRTVGFGGMALSGFGAYSGYEIGKSIAGIPGGFAGAFAGAHFGKGIARHPGVFLPLAVGAFALKEAGSFAVSAVSHVVKEGHRRRKMRGRIDTAGDTAAFFNKNAITMRGRAFESMRKSHLNARSALGMEANMTHMNRNYF